MSVTAGNVEVWERFNNMFEQWLPLSHTKGMPFLRLPKSCNPRRCCNPRRKSAFGPQRELVRPARKSSGASKRHTAHNHHAHGADEALGVAIVRLPILLPGPRQLYTNGEP